MIIVSAIVISTFSLIYGLIGKEIKNTYLINQKSNLNKYFLLACYRVNRNENSNAIKLVWCFCFFMFICSVLLYKIISLHPSFKEVEYYYKYELPIYVLLLVLGFRKKLVFESELKALIKQLGYLAIKILLGLNAIIFIVYFAFHEPSTFLLPILNLNLTFIIFFSVFNLILLIIYRFLPQLLSSILVFTSRFIIKKIIENDKKDPISGLFRYFKYIAAITTLIQLVIMWIW